MMERNVTVTEDDMFEDLPPRLRKKVLASWANGGVEPVEPSSPQAQAPSIAFMAPAVILGVPIFLVGLVLTCTVLLAPIGVPLMVLACVPAKRSLQKHDYSKG